MTARAFGAFAIFRFGYARSNPEASRCCTRIHPNIWRRGSMYPYHVSRRDEQVDRILAIRDAHDRQIVDSSDRSD